MNDRLPEETRAQIERILSALERGESEVFRQECLTYTGGNLALPARDAKDILFLGMPLFSGDYGLVDRVIDAIARSNPGTEKAVWARIFRVVLANAARSHGIVVRRLKEIVLAEAGASDVEAGTFARVMTMGRRRENLRSLLSGLRAECTRPIALDMNGRDGANDLGGGTIALRQNPGEDYLALKSLLLPSQAHAVDYYRALAAGKGDILILEDDVRLCRGWWDALQAAIRQAASMPDVFLVYLLEAAEAETPSGKYALVPRNTTEPLCLLPPQGFVGTQAIWFPAPVRERLKDVLLPLVFEDFKSPIDLALGVVGQQMGLSFYATGRSLVQHMRTGERVTPGYHHQAIHLLGELY